VTPLADAIGNAVRHMRLATGEIEQSFPADDRMDKAAQRRGGRMSARRPARAGGVDGANSGRRREPHRDTGTREHAQREDDRAYDHLRRPA
jgi:hypothetical protein